jgi:hypothetical protein
MERPESGRSGIGSYIWGRLETGYRHRNILARVYQVADRRDAEFMSKTVSSGVLVVETNAEDWPGGRFRREFVNWFWWRKQ